MSDMEKLLIEIAVLMSEQRWEKWRKDKNACALCSQNTCREYLGWQAELEGFDHLITNVRRDSK